MTNFIQEPFKKIWDQQGFEQMSPIQEALYPIIQSGESVIAVSPTGTGKTLAYLLPLLAQVEKNNTLQLIVLAPSQELVKQIGEVAELWGRAKELEVLTILGSANMQRQINALKDKPEVIVASPGRLYELSEQSRKLKLHLVKAIVYDEADYLYEDEQAITIEKFTNKLMRDVQKVWVSATFGPALVKVAAEMGESVRVVNVDHQSLDNIEHFGLIVQNRQKIQYLKRLSHVEGMQAIVFFEQVNEVDQVAAKLIYDGLNVVSLHGQLSKLEREHAINAFREGKATYLLTTDVSARGLDIADLPFVIHYNRVNDARTYLHRSGRTGRMGNKGTVLSLLNEQEFRDLAHILMNEGVNLQERAYYQGKLVTIEERDALRLANIEVEKEQSIKRKAQAKSRANQPKSKKKVVKKKNRLRDTKNKGKRRGK